MVNPAHHHQRKPKAGKLAASATGSAQKTECSTIEIACWAVLFAALSLPLQGCCSGVVGDWPRGEPEHLRRCFS